MKTCPFYNISQREIIKKGKNVYVILSNPRLMPGHLLIITKRHIQRLEELTKEERKELFNMIIKFEKKILEKLAPGCDIRQHHHPYLKNNKIAVNHFHVHLLPRRDKDALFQKSQKFEIALFKKLPEEEEKKISRLLKD